MSFKHAAIATVTTLATLLGPSLTMAADAPPEVKVSPNGEITVVATLDVKPGSEADFEKAARLSIKCTRLEPGSVTFSIHRALDRSTPTYVMYEVWRDLAALQSHFVQPYTQALFASFKLHLIAQPAMSFVAELTPASRPPLAVTNPKNLSECR